MSFCELKSEGLGACIILHFDVSAVSALDIRGMDLVLYINQSRYI